ncbi:hypothetical protein L593_09435 [Salinarchaeum sp. Harcht-Bsk1]|uniref:hypothetical protein n=1 Tax=Salinarchaeum sp. Harcht-Bsk1 TaxID=1333523 RepID=UPI00034228A1|nr:hypothetical protein [Salinarchaeum sp. Harcht-Bsk1]AGN01832.1 hypothetical protein L593_09435 [Salinarchaeum sp. Harcht-Bsk1]
MVDIDEAQAKDGAIVGAIAFVVGLIGSVLFVTPSSGDDVFKITASAMGQTQSQTMTWGSLGGSGTSKPETWKVAGWVYHKAHFASIDVNFSGFSSIGSNVSVNGSFVMDVPLLVQLLPIVLLGAAGFVLAERWDADDPKDAAINGAHVVAGYAPLAVLSTFLLSWSQSSSSSGISASVTVEPALVSALLFTGLAAPLVLGALGGVVNHEFGDDILEAIGQKG